MIHDQDFILCLKALHGTAHWRLTQNADYANV